jgi:hypothetical protein
MFSNMTAQNSNIFLSKLRKKDDERPQKDQMFAHCSGVTNLYREYNKAIPAELAAGLEKLMKGVKAKSADDKAKGVCTHFTNLCSLHRSSHGNMAHRHWQLAHWQNPTHLLDVWFTRPKPIHDGFSRVLIYTLLLDSLLEFDGASQQRL